MEKSRSGGGLAQFVGVRSTYHKQILNLKAPHAAMLDVPIIPRHFSFLPAPCIPITMLNPPFFLISYFVFLAVCRGFFHEIRLVLSRGLRANYV